MKIHKIQLFILNLFYKNSETPRSYGEVVAVCRKKYSKSPETIRKDFDKLINVGFLKKERHDRYRLPYIKTKQGKQYNRERFLKKIIETYELDKYYYLYEDDEINHLWKKLTKVYSFSSPSAWSKRKTEEMNIRFTMNLLSRSYFPEARVLYFSVLQKLKKQEEISIESILKDLKECEQSLLKEVDGTALPVIDHYLNNRLKDSKLFFIFSKLRKEIESEKRRRIKNPIRWDI